MQQKATVLKDYTMYSLSRAVLFRQPTLLAYMGLERPALMCSGGQQRGVGLSANVCRIQEAYSPNTGERATGKVWWHTIGGLCTNNRHRENGVAKTHLACMTLACLCKIQEREIPPRISPLNADCPTPLSPNPSYAHRTPQYTTWAGIATTPDRIPSFGVPIFVVRGTGYRRSHQRRQPRHL